MNPLLKKMQLKDELNPILVLNAPDEYKEIMNDFQIPVHETPELEKYMFVQVFGINNEILSQYAKEALKVFDTEGLLWLCYPKKSSKKYKGSDCDRTSVAFMLGEEGYEPVRQVAVDTDWSALRLRPVDQIKSMTRTFAASEKGKERIKDNKK